MRTHRPWLIGARVLFLVCGIILLIRGVVSFNGLPAALLMTGSGPDDPVYALALLHWIAAPWLEALVGVSALFLLGYFLGRFPERRRLLRGALLLVAVLTLDIAYKTWVSYGEMAYYAENARWPFPGLPWDLRAHSLRQFQDPSPHSRLRGWWGEKRRVERIRTPKTRVQATATPSPTPTIDPTEARIAALPEIQCFPAPGDAAKWIEWNEAPAVLARLFPGKGSDLDLEAEVVARIKGGACEGMQVVRWLELEPDKPAPGTYVTLESNRPWEPRAESSAKVYSFEDESRAVIFGGGKYYDGFLNRFQGRSLLRHPEGEYQRFFETPIQLSWSDPPLQLEKRFEGRTSELMTALKSKGNNSQVMVGQDPLHGPLYFMRGEGVSFSGFYLLRKDGYVVYFQALNHYWGIEGYGFTGISNLESKDLESSQATPGTFTLRDRNSEKVHRGYVAYQRYVEEFKKERDEALERCKKVSIPVDPTREDGMIECIGSAFEMPKAFTESQFFDSRPWVFWIDPLKRVHQFSKLYPLFPRMVEPITYLYSDAPRRVNLRFDPQVKVTQSIPDYGDGWSVEVWPGGMLWDISARKLFRFLYWEGVSGMASPFESGWSVSEGDVPGFLRGKVSELGLEGQEIEDFLGYWQRALRGAPYFLIRFLEPEEVGRLAPLSLDPPADTVIRVYLDYKKVGAPRRIPAPAPRPKVKRKGFTWVEWGGLEYP